jgi:hypothetical protein
MPKCGDTHLCNRNVLFTVPALAPTAPTFACWTPPLLANKTEPEMRALTGRFFSDKPILFTDVRCEKREGAEKRGCRKLDELGPVWQANLR